MAENGCIRVGQTSSVYTLPIYILERAVGAFKICGSRPMNIPNAKTQRWSGLRVFPAPAKMQCTASSWGITDSHYPCVRAFPECLPYSLYIIFSKKEDLRGDTPSFRDYRSYLPMGFPGFLIRLSPSSWSCGFEICDDCLQVHLSPVRSSCHFNRWLGCLIK